MWLSQLSIRLLILAQVMIPPHVRLHTKHGAGLGFSLSLSLPLPLSPIHSLSLSKNKNKLNSLFKRLKNIHQISNGGHQCPSPFHDRDRNPGPFQTQYIAYSLFPLPPKVQNGPLISGKTNLPWGPEQYGCFNTTISFS